MSTLQIHSIMYRFHPSVQYDSPYPIQKQIRQQIVDLWERYGLQERTVFDCPVKSVRQNPNGKWIINDDEAQHGLFDGIVVAVGVTGNPKMPGLPGRENFRGPIFHSSKIDEKEIKGKRVLVIGSGASGTEAVEAAVRVGASGLSHGTSSSRLCSRVTSSGRRRPSPGFPNGRCASSSTATCIPSRPAARACTWTRP